MSGRSLSTNSWSVVTPYPRVPSGVALRKQANRGIQGRWERDSSAFLSSPTGSDSAICCRFHSRSQQQCCRAAVVRAVVEIEEAILENSDPAKVPSHPLCGVTQSASGPVRSADDAEPDMDIG